MQLVVSGNRILAHGEDCFLAMGGTVICTASGRVYQNATVVTCDGCPSDIGERGYEYHAGQFVPCAPYGKSEDGYLALLCGEDCRAIKDSGLLLSALLKKVAGPTVTDCDFSGWDSGEFTVTADGEATTGSVEFDSAERPTSITLNGHTLTLTFPEVE